MPLPQTHDEALAAAARLAEALEPGAIDRDRNGAGAVPRDALDLLDSSGLIGLTVPRADGGPGLGLRTLAQVVQRIAAADPAIAQVPQAHFLMVDLLAVHGRPELRKRLYDELATGDLVAWLRKRPPASADLALAARNRRSTPSTTRPTGRRGSPRETRRSPECGVHSGLRTVSRTQYL